MGDVSLADAIIKDIPNFDQELAYQAIRKDAFEVPPSNLKLGRDCLTTYINTGIAEGMISLLLQHMSLHEDLTVKLAAYLSLDLFL